MGGLEKETATLESEKAGAEPRLTTRRWSYLLIALVIILISIVRFHLRNIPLERDEGEYAYAGQLMLQGIPPYKLAYNMKLPGTYAAYALIMAVFGQTPAGVHLGLLVANAITIFLVFLLACRLADPIAGVVAGASYGLLSASPSVLGFAGHATHFVVLAAVAGILLFLDAIEKKRLWLFFWSGILLGLAFVMKQPGAIFAVFAGLYLLSTERERPVNWRDLGTKFGLLSLGVVIPFALTCLIVWRAGVFGTFWFWTISYASQYATNTGIGEGVHLFAKAFPAIVGPSIWIWLIAAVGLTSFLWDQESRKRAAFVLGFFLFSFLAVCPDFDFREHYFILMLPAVAVLAGIAVSAGMKTLRAHPQTTSLRFLPVVLFVIALGGTFYQQRDFFLETDPIAICRHIYGGNPFPEAIPVADYIRQHTPENATIAVLGSEPEIYFYAHRHSATGYIYTYGLMEEQKYALHMQQQMISEIEAAHPEMLVFVDVQASWLPRQHSQGLIFAWLNKYIHDQYELTGVAGIHAHQTDYRWGDEVKTYQPTSNSNLFVFKRKTP